MGTRAPRLYPATWPYGARSCGQPALRGAGPGLDRPVARGVDGDVDMVLVVGRVAAPAGHVAPAIAGALVVPDVLVPDDVVDAQLLGVGPRPPGQPEAESPPRLGLVVGDHAVDGATTRVVRQ